MKADTPDRQRARETGMAHWHARRNRQRAGLDACTDYPTAPKGVPWAEIFDRGLDEGLTNQEIGAILGVAAQSVRQARLRWARGHRKSGGAPERYPWAELFADGAHLRETPSELARRLGVGRSVVYDAFARHDITKWKTRRARS